MKKINIGKLVNENYSTDEVIEWLAGILTEVAGELSKAVEQENLGSVGVCLAMLSQCTSVAKALNEKVNGKKPTTVL